MSHDKKTPAAISLDVLRRLKEAKTSRQSAPIDVADTPPAGATGTAGRVEPPADTDTRPRRARTTPPIMPPKDLRQKLFNEPAPAPLDAHPSANDEMDDEYDWASEQITKVSPASVKALDSIPAPLGVSADSGGAVQMFCGQPDWAFASRSPDVPVSSYYPDWIWHGLKQKYNETAVEMYVMANEQYGDPVERETVRFDGSSVKSTFTPRNKPVFSIDHQCLMTVTSRVTPPWGSARRVMLIPLTHIDVEIKEGRAAPYTEHKHNIAGAQPMLWGDDTTLHVIHGRCAISFTDDNGNDHMSEYWVILPFDDLKRIHNQRYQTAEDRLLYGQDRTSKPTTYARPNERFLGVWRGEEAKRVYLAAKDKVGAVMPKGWLPDEVSRLNLLHFGKDKRRKDREEQKKSTIVSPLHAAAHAELAKRKPQLGAVNKDSVQANEASHDECESKVEDVFDAFDDDSPFDAPPEQPEQPERPRI